VYYTYNDYQGNILTLTDATGTVVAERNYDAWGRDRNPVDWTYNNLPTLSDWFYRGYTGHEHLKEFALINMNGRLYDPIQCRMLNPDNYVQLPYATQSYNRYSYCINNPLIYSDKTGDLFGINLVTGFIKGLLTGEPPFKTAWEQEVNSYKIIGGMFAMNSHLTVLQNIVNTVSRFTYQLPQQALGLAVATVENTLGLVTKVSYYDGATVINTTYQKNSTIRLLPDGTYSGGRSGQAVTFGSFINGPSEMQADPNDPLFVHEYGRYLQSQAQGLVYLFYTAIPNFSPWGGNDDYTSHDANARSFIYFNTYHGRFGTDFQWDFRADVGAPIPGYNPGSPYESPNNQAALRRNKAWFW
jgi:RHS repeat-associated protein